MGHHEAGLRANRGTGASYAQHHGSGGPAPSVTDQPGQPGIVHDPLP